MQTSLPVVRFGRLLSVQQYRRDRGLSYSEGERVYGQIDVIHWSDSIRRASREAIRGVLLDPPEAQKLFKQLSPASASGFSAIGLTYDFDEFALRIGDAIVLARACVTLCVNDKGPLGRPSKEEPSHSKLWMRFIMVPPEGKQRESAGTPVSPATLREFTSNCRKIADRTFVSAREILDDTLRSCIKDKTLRVDLLEEIATISMSTSDPSFFQLYQAIENGECFSNELYRKNPAANFLASTAHYFARGAPSRPNPSVLTRLLSKDHSTGICLTPQRQHGIYLSSASPHQAIYFVLTNDREKQAKVPWTKSPANMISAALTNTVAALF